MWWLLGAVSPEAPAPDGAELFSRTWVPMDPRSAMGDGLGPTFNADSCAACHPGGGAGGAHADVRVIAGRSGETEVRFRFVSAELGREMRKLAVEPSRRQTPALFGAGAIDRIPDGELLVAEALGVPGFPEISGRVGRDEHDRPTRFGWKGQTATLASFVESACANELGLETAAIPQPGGGSPGIDLSDRELGALIGFVASLPAPNVLPTPGADRGREVFDRIGCGACHTPDLGEVSGLYSDLLLHDLGEGLSDRASSYGVRTSKPRFGSTIEREWRTPPLWGLRDSAPYLHDGRASTVEQAIGLHGGEASAVIRAWRSLSPEDSGALRIFLRSLSAPTG